MYVCIYMFLHISTHTGIYTYNTYLCTCAFVYVFVCVSGSADVPHLSSSFINKFFDFDNSSDILVLRALLVPFLAE